MLAIFVDHESDFVGSRQIGTLGIEDKDEIMTYLENEFPGFTCDEVILVKNDIVIESWVIK